jgi:Radical SAM superfamily/4Fe-4S single cluster domain
VEQQFTIDRSSDQASHDPIMIKRAASDRSNKFKQSRFGTNSESLLRTIRRSGASPAELLPILAILNHESITSFTSLRTLHRKAHAGSIPAPSAACIQIMRDLALESVDQELQGIYRAFLRTRRFRPGSNHAQKIETLEGCRDRVREVLTSYDWRCLADWLELRRIGETAESCVQRLANFAFPMERVNFRFTYHCNIACRHCYNSSGPYQKAKRIARETMLAVVKQMPEAGIKYLNLTGGEPLLYPDDVMALIAAGRAARLDGISIYTNGFWARTDLHAEQTLERLAQVGFMQGRGDHIKVSTGAYHQEFIAFDRILTLARAYHRRFAERLPVDFELAPGARLTIEDVRHRINSAGLNDQIKLWFRDVAPLGRGREIPDIRVSEIDAPCQAINEIAFDPDGNVRPCCGLNNENHGIVIGRTDRHCLKTLAKRMQNDPILQFLSMHRLDRIFDHVAAPKNSGGYHGSCDLCQDALGGLIDKEALQAALFDRQKFYPFWFTLSS